MNRKTMLPIMAFSLALLVLTACEPPRMPTTQPATQAVSAAPAPPSPPAPPTTAPATALEQVQQKAQEAYESARGWAGEMRDKYWNSARDELNKLVERARDAASGMKPEFERRLRELQDRANEAAKSLDEARKAGGQAFDDAKKRFEQTLEEYRRAIGGVPTTQPATKPAAP